MTAESIGLHLLPLMIAGVMLVATDKNHATTATVKKADWTNGSLSLSSRAAWYDTGVTVESNRYFCPPLPDVANAHLVYDGLTVAGETRPSRRRDEGTVATYVCETHYKISSENYNYDVLGLHDDHVKFACVPEFITFNMGSYKSRTNVSYVCSKSADGHGQWILLRGNSNNPFHKKAYDGGKQPTGDWRQTKANTVGGNNKPYPTSVIYNTWSLRDLDGMNAGGDRRTWWTRLGRTVEDRFLVLASCFTVLIMFSFVLRGIFRTFCVIDWTPPPPPPMQQPPVTENQPSSSSSPPPPPPQVEHEPFQRLPPRHADGSANISILTPILTPRELVLVQDASRQNDDASHPHRHHDHSTDDFSLILLPIRKESPDTTLPSYEEATGLPSYDDICCDS